MGFVWVPHHLWVVLVYTLHGYSVCGYRYGVGKPDLRYTRVQPYRHPEKSNGIA